MVKKLDILIIRSFAGPFLATFLIALFVLTFILTIVTQSYQKGMAGSLRFIPLLIISQFKSLLKIKKAKNNFLKTEHKKVMYIDELLGNELS